MMRRFFLRALPALALCVPLCALLSVGVRAEPEGEDEAEPEEMILEIAPAEPSSAGDGDYGALVAADDPDAFRPVLPIEVYELDPHTGEKLDEIADGETNEYYPLSPGEYGYDKISHLYLNYVGQRSFTSSVPNGAVLSSGARVSIQIPAGLNGILYRDGDLLPDQDLAQIEGVGAYLLVVQSAQSTENVQFSFRILADVTNSLNELSLPSGFRFGSILLDGEEIESDYSNYCEFLDDGSYQISWGCDPIGQLYTLAFVRDTQTPALTIEGLFKEPPQGEANGPVTLSWEDKSAYVLVRTADGNERRIGASPTELTSSGEYTVTIRDAAGNSASYDFIIHVYLNLSAYVSIALALLGVGLLIGYSRHIKKHSRVG